MDAAPDPGAASDSGAAESGTGTASESGIGRARGGGRPVHVTPRARRVENATRGTVLADFVEIADGLWGKFMGLMGRASLPAGHAMWLPESNGIHMMFMRFGIDAVFVGRPDVDGSRRVVSIHRGLPAWRGLVPLVRAAHGVLELPVGTIDATATEVGDRLLIG